MRAFAPACWIALCAVCAPLSLAAQKEPPVPKELLVRVAVWAEKLLAESPSYTAEETMEETRRGRKGAPGARQRVVSRYALRRLGAHDQVETAESREPLAGNGKEAPNSAKRGEEIAPRAAGREPFADPLRLVARFTPRNLEKMKLFFAPDTSDPPSEHVLLGYRQVAGQALAELDGKRVFPSGQGWVDADDGRIVRIEEELQHKNRRVLTSVEFAHDDVLDAWVPRTILVRVFDKGRLELQRLYTYSNFQRLGAADSAGVRSRPR